MGLALKHAKLLGSPSSSNIWARANEWRQYETVRHGTFHFKNEAVRYCQNDVDILFEACCIFRKGYIGETGVDPFSCVTIASACMKVFRTNFLAANTLAIPSPDNYRRQFKSFSNVSIQWLEWVVFREHLHSALTEPGGEGRRQILCRWLRRDGGCEMCMGVSGMILSRLSLIFQASEHPEVVRILTQYRHHMNKMQG
ncbi:hypothetical protein F2P81_025759 [Scophthalmus maximus]|uniref:DNA-directed DNA polymerase n=1 Tax=Scophthalmus maximus TaxID=52904 RepID=A0A6A4RPD7_SCOMX|nr:hypothetical protein F2P81_025759 [Scophthalmus maximus]